MRTSRLLCCQCDSSQVLLCDFVQVSPADLGQSEDVVCQTPPVTTGPALQPFAQLLKADPDVVHQGVHVADQTLDCHPRGCLLVRRRACHDGCCKRFVYGIVAIRYRSSHH